jgi:hypothetical protein
MTGVYVHNSALSQSAEQKHTFNNEIFFSFLFATDVLDPVGEVKKSLGHSGTINNSAANFQETIISQQ